MAQSHTHSTRLNWFAAIIGILLPFTYAAAAWPTDPSMPLVLGNAEGIFLDRQSVVVTNDQAIWVSWQDSFCGGSVRVQRISNDGVLLTPMGIDAQEDPTCGFLLPPLLIPSLDAVVVTRAQSASSEYPIRSYSPDGTERWPDGYAIAEAQGIGTGTALENADVLLTTSTFGGMIHVDRIDADGERVWAEQTVFQNDAGSNFKILACVPDTLGGSFIFWDSPTTYRRSARVTRINGDGTLAWAESLRIFGDDIFNQGSRHTPSTAIADGSGGAVYIWSHGQETGTTPVPIKMQRIGADRTFSFPFEGARISLGIERQFDADVDQDEATGDLFITWRNGFIDDASVRAQRITLAGERIWGDEGIEISALENLNDSFDAVWVNGKLAIAIADSAGVRVHQVDAQGASIGPSIPVGTSGPGSSLSMVKSENALVIVWQQDEPGNADQIVAQRLNPNGLLGGPMCSPADFTGNGSLDIFDVFAFLDAFAAGNSAADFTNDELLDIFDVFAYLEAFEVGCP